MQTRNIKFFHEYYKDLNNGKLAAKNSLYTRKSKKTNSKKFKDISEFIDSNSSILLNKRTGFFRLQYVVGSSQSETLRKKYKLNGRFNHNSHLLDELNLKISENNNYNKFANCFYLKKLDQIQFKIRKKHSKQCLDSKNKILKPKPIHFLDIKIKTIGKTILNI
jgi:hypothetical protein